MRYSKKNNWSYFDLETPKYSMTLEIRYQCFVAINDHKIVNYYNHHLNYEGDHTQHLPKTSIRILVLWRHHNIHGSYINMKLLRRSLSEFIVSSTIPNIVCVFWWLSLQSIIHRNFNIKMFHAIFFFTVTTLYL